MNYHWFRNKQLMVVQKDKKSHTIATKSSFTFCDTQMKMEIMRSTKMMNEFFLVFHTWSSLQIFLQHCIHCNNSNLYLNLFGSVPVCDASELQNMKCDIFVANFFNTMSAATLVTQHRNDTNSHQMQSWNSILSIQTKETNIIPSSTRKSFLEN